MKRKVGAASLGAAIAFVLTGCAAGAQAPADALGCEPGAVVACGCLDGTPSMQTCDANGESFGACACSAMPVPPGASAAPAAPMPNAQPAANMEPATTPAASAAPSEMPAAPAPSPFVPMWPWGVQPSAMAAAPQPSSSGAAGTPPGWAATAEVPQGEHCAPVAVWSSQWNAFEQEVLLLTNQRRAQGASCGQFGTFAPAAPLVMNQVLRCSSRLHSKDMGVQNYFAHDNLDGLDPYDRMADAGYSGLTMGENIAKGQQSPSEVVTGWMNSPGHCSNIMNPQYTEIGVGFFAGAPADESYNDNTLWTQNFGAPRNAVHCDRGNDPSC